MYHRIASPEAEVEFLLMQSFSPVVLFVPFVKYLKEVGNFLPSTYVYFMSFKFRAVCVEKKFTREPKRLFFLGVFIALLNLKIHKVLGRRKKYSEFTLEPLPHIFFQEKMI